MYLIKGVGTMGRVKEVLKRVWRVPYVRHPLLIIGVALVLVLFVLAFLHFYTRHGVEFALTDFRGMLLEEAKESGDDQGIRLVVYDSVYIMTLHPGEVIAQQPVAGTRVKKNRRVFLTVNSMSPQYGPAPDVVGISLRQALMDLERTGYTVGRISLVPDIALFNVLEQSYEGRRLSVGDSIPKGSAIDLTLGAGFDSLTVTVPLVLGMTLRDARMRLATSALNVNRVEYDATVQSLSDSLSARVYSIHPRASAGGGVRRVPAGFGVDLWLTLNEQRIELERGMSGGGSR